MEDLAIIPALLNARDSARYLSVSFSEFRAHIQPELPYIQRVPNGKIWHARTDLDAWIKKNRRQPAAAS